MLVAQRPGALFIFIERDGSERCRGGGSTGQFILNHKS
jgi:hypothetical protein